MNIRAKRDEIRSDPQSPDAELDRLQADWLAVPADLDRKEHQETYEYAVEQGQRFLEKQDAQLDRMRVRAVALLAATFGLLGVSVRPVLDRLGATPRPEFVGSFWFWVLTIAISGGLVAAIVGTVVLALRVNMALGARPGRIMALADKNPDGPRWRLYRGLAYHADKAIIENRRILTTKSRWLCVVLVGSLLAITSSLVLLWLTYLIV